MVDDLDVEWQRYCEWQRYADSPGGDWDLPAPPPRPLAGELLATALGLRPGPDAMGLLETIDPTELDEAQQVDWVACWDRQHSWTAANRWTAIGHVAVTTPRRASAG